LIGAIQVAVSQLLLLQQVPLALRFLAGQAFGLALLRLSPRPRRYSDRRFWRKTASMSVPEA
jgi:hypothetical protein